MRAPRRSRTGALSSSFPVSAIDPSRELRLLPPIPATNDLLGTLMPRGLKMSNKGVLLHVEAINGPNLPRPQEIEGRRGGDRSGTDERSWHDNVAD